jgi:hypothetical protein
MAFLPLFRSIALNGAVVFAIIVLGLAAHLTAVTEEFLDGYFVSAAMGIASAVLTIISLPVMIGIESRRRNAFTSMVIVELVWLSVLWILWLATTGLAAQDQSFSFGAGSSCDFFNEGLVTACHESAGILAFSVLTWLFLMGYSVTLLVYAIIGATRGNRTWTSTVRDDLLTRSGPDSAAAPPLADKQLPMQTGTSVAPSTMQYPPQQYGQPTHSPMTAQV